jgi:uncharacterized membrane protein YeaQ/YmgE (transglycosylase-associated protein family)
MNVLRPTSDRHRRSAERHGGAAASGRIPDRAPRAPPRSARWRGARRWHRICISSAGARRMVCRALHRRRIVMGLIVWLVIGGIVGWLASVIMGRDAQQGILMNIVVGIVGAVLAGWFVSPLVGVATINQGISVGTVLVSLLGAIVLLAIVNLIRRGAVR